MTRLTVPQEVSLGDIVTAQIRPVCMGGGSVAVSFGIGSKGANDSDHQITKHTSETINLKCNQDHTLQFKVTNEMVSKQRSGRLNGVYATQPTGKGIATAYFRIKVPGAIMGSVRVFRRYSCRSGRSGPIATWFFDIYHNGIAEAMNNCFGDGYACPSCRIMDEYTGEYARKYKYIRQSLYDSRASNAEEKAWMDANLIVVPNNWTPMDGLPQPEIDPCEGVECSDVCDDVSLYSQTCEGGVCVKGDIVTPNATECGYVPPPPPDPEPPEPKPPEPEPDDEPYDDPDNGDPDEDPSDTPDEYDMQFDIQSILDSMGLSMKHATYAILILIVIFLMSRLS